MSYPGPYIVQRSLSVIWYRTSGVGVTSRSFIEARPPNSQQLLFSSSYLVSYTLLAFIHSQI